jgi:hypothetical protein
MTSSIKRTVLAGTAIAALAGSALAPLASADAAAPAKHTRT